MLAGVSSSINASIKKSFVTFTGDGSTTDFVVPETISDFGHVFIDGVYQTPDDNYTYDVATKTISLTAAPVSGVKIVINYFTRGISTSVYDSHALSVFAWMVRDGAAPSDAVKNLINNLIKGIKADDNWTKLEIFRPYTAHSVEASRLNWISDQYHATDVASPTFVQYDGVSFNGTTQYRKSGFNPNSAIRVSKNNMIVGANVITNDDVSNNRYLFGSKAGSDLTTILQLPASNKIRHYVNTDSLSNYTVSGGFTAADYAAKRSAAGANSLWVDGVSVQSGTAAATNIPNQELYEGAINDGGVLGSDPFKGKLGMFYVGTASLNIATLIARFQTFRTAMISLQ